MKNIILLSFALFCSFSQASSNVQIDCGGPTPATDSRFVETRLLVTANGFNLSSYGHSVNYFDLTTTRDGYVLTTDKRESNQVVLNFSYCRNSKATLVVTSNSVKSKPQVCSCTSY